MISFVFIDSGETTINSLLTFVYYIILRYHVNSSWEVGAFEKRVSVNFTALIKRDLLKVQIESNLEN